MCFNPRPHAGGDLAEVRAMYNRAKFQSTPPRGGRPFRSSCGQSYWSFNPRPHAGGDKICLQNTLNQREFQSTPPRGGRRFFLPISRVNISFQSTPPRGGRLAQPCQYWLSVPHVSIHAPTRGATCRCSSPACAMSFQSTPPRGGRLLHTIHTLAGHMFQSTPPRGGRLRIQKIAEY